MVDVASDIVITGTGRLARAICYSLATVPQHRYRVAVLGRNEESINELLAVARGRAVAFKSQLTFAGWACNWDCTPSVADLFTKLRPRVVVHTASLQSPWEFCSPLTLWGQLVRDAGFGYTLPLQAVLAARLASLLKTALPDSILINGCYPDAVNALLATLDLKPLCGIGNINILATIIRSQLPTDSRADSKLIAHHFNISAIYSGDFSHLHLYFADNQKATVQDLRSLLKPLTRIRGAELNHVTGATTLTLLLPLLNNGEADIHLPGPNGYVGGYPVRLTRGLLSLALPDGVSVKDAEAFNHEASIMDGVVVEPNGEIIFTRFPRINPAIRSKNRIPERWHADALERIALDMVRLRRDLGSSGT